MTYLAATSHFFVSSRRSQTAHHSSSMQSPTRILPSSTQESLSPSGSGATLSSKESRCQRCSGRSVFVYSIMSVASAVAETRSVWSWGR